jgi:lipoyl(octanoyl) transferase
MDLAPFLEIDTCGYPGLRVTQMRDLGVEPKLDAVSLELSAKLTMALANPR